MTRLPSGGRQLRVYTRPGAANASNAANASGVGGLADGGVAYASDTLGANAARMAKKRTQSSASASGTMLTHVSQDSGESGIM